MHVEEFTDYSNDYLTFMKSILEEKTIKSPGKAFKKLPRFILAHSLGTIIGIRLREVSSYLHPAVTVLNILLLSTAASWLGLYR